MTVNEACWRYWEEFGCRHKTSDDTAAALESIRRLLGSATLLVDVDQEVILQAVRRRAGEQIRRLKKDGERLRKMPVGKAVSNATVNRTFTEPLRRLLRKAKKAWKVPIDLDDYDWSDLLLPEPSERIREIQQGEETRFWQELRSDYHPLVELYMISGRRLSDWIELSKFKVDLPSRTARFPSRKKKRPGEIIVTLTQREFEIVAGEMAKHNHEAVFTYEVQRGKDKGLRRPITKNGFRRVFTNALVAAGIRDFRRHDLRHTFGTRLLRETGNLKLVQKAMDHSDIQSTLRYAHVLDEEVVSARSTVPIYRNSPGAVDIRTAKSDRKRQK